MIVTWNKCTDNVWCTLSRLNLETVTESAGIYIIWKPGNPSRVIRVGQGNIRDRLYDHRNDPAITVYGRNLLVTWARVPAYQLDGVERYLAEELKPAVGERFPNSHPIAVNIP